MHLAFVQEWNYEWSRVDTKLYNLRLLYFCEWNCNYTVEFKVIRDDYVKRRGNKKNNNNSNNFITQLNNVL